MTALHKFGRNPDMGMAAEETVWAVGGIYTFPSKDEALSIVSDDANDASAGTGQRTVMIEGLDKDFNVLEETVTLDGVTPVVTTAHFLRVNRVRGITAGSNGRNVGGVTLSAPTQGLTLANMEAGLGQTQLGIYSVAANAVVGINEVFIYPFKSQSAFYEVRMLLCQFGESWNLKGTLGGHTQGPGSTRRYNPAFVLPPRSDLEFRCTVSANNVGISVEFSGLIEYRSV